MNQSLIYLDNSATTPLCPEAVEAMEEAMACYGNPSSLHGAGQYAHALIERARGRADLYCLGNRGECHRHFRHGVR